jgi:hypothetical protein
MAKQVSRDKRSMNDELINSFFSARECNQFDPTNFIAKDAEHFLNNENFYSDIKSRFDISTEPELCFSIDKTIASNYSRTTSSRKCKFPDCPKAARDKSFCVAHGGGKVIYFEICFNLI